MGWRRRRKAGVITALHRRYERKSALVEAKKRRALAMRSEGRRVWQRTRGSPMRLLAASAVFGSWAFSAMAAPLSPENAAGHIGETATVCGVVASSKYEANAQSQPTLLDLGKPHPEAVFTAVIYGDNRQNLGPSRHHFAANELCDGADQRLPR